MGRRSEFTQMILNQFEEMLRQSERHPLVCGISLHTFVAGQPFRLAQLRRALTTIKNCPEANRVWFARPGNIASDVEALDL